MSSIGGRDSAMAQHDIEDYAFVNLADERYSEVVGFPALGRAAYGGFKLRF